jgi:hypothetical protein
MNGRIKTVLNLLILFVVFVSLIFYFRYTNSLASKSNYEKVAVKEYAKKQEESDYVSKYKSLLSCKSDYKKLSEAEIRSKIEPDDFKYKEPASPDTHKLSIVRGIVVYFPMVSFNHFQSEFLWMYRSWIEMQKSEPSKWRTDLIIFINDIQIKANDKLQFFNDLNCTFTNKRTSPASIPMCTLVNYMAMSDRRDSFLVDKNPRLRDKNIYQYFFKELDVFDPNPADRELFLNLLKNNLATYGYLDSILVAYEGYEYFKSAGYNFLIR